MQIQSLFTSLLLSFLNCAKASERYILPSQILSTCRRLMSCLSEGVDGRIVSPLDLKSVSDRARMNTLLTDHSPRVESVLTSDERLSVQVLYFFHLGRGEDR
jgi:hypothetical protein